jgi:hypothetical protein
MMRLAFAGTVVFLMIALVGIGGAAAPDILSVAGRNGVKLGEPAPNFQLPDLIGLAWQSGAAELLGHLVRALPGGDAGDGTALPDVFAEGF